MVAFTREPSSIYSCLHVQHTQQTGDLPPLSTSGIITASLLLKLTIPLRRESQRSALPLPSYTITSTIPGEREPWLQSIALNSEGNQTWLSHNPRDAFTDQSWTDRQTRVRPQKTHPFPPAHTGARTAPRSVPQTMQMGNGPIPLGKAKEASFEISGVPKS